MLLRLYRQYVSADVQLSDLVQDGKYNPRNKWNMPELQGKRGVLMHMAFFPNTLEAAVVLSAEATWPSVDDNGDLITDEQGLIDCRGFGARERHSDPHIGAQINGLVRAGNEVSLAGPTGLYIDSINTSGFKTPDDSPPESWYRVVRGQSDHMLRVVFEAPAESGHALGDVEIDGSPLTFGGQLAEKLTIRIRGLARAVEQGPPKLKCSGSVVLPPNLAAFINPFKSRRDHVAFMISDE